MQSAGKIKPRLSLIKCCTVLALCSDNSLDHVNICNIRSTGAQQYVSQTDSGGNPDTASTTAPHAGPIQSCARKSKGLGACRVVGVMKGTVLSAIQKHSATSAIAVTTHWGVNAAHSGRTRQRRCRAATLAATIQ